jgi:DnaJ-class molecular chaperone
MARHFLLALVTASLLWIGASFGFVVVPTPSSITGRRHPAALMRMPRLMFARKEQEESFLLQEFKTHTGEVVNPYAVLKISRSADIAEIKASYRALSRRYHPDVMRHKDILPGSCNNMEEVRDEWERIKLSYEILKDKQTRKRFDRHEMIADPNAAIQRAAWNAMGQGIQGMTKGILNIGAFAVEKLATSKNKKDEMMNGKQQEPEESS